MFNNRKGAEMLRLNSEEPLDQEASLRVIAAFVKRAQANFPAFVAKATEGNSNPEESWVKIQGENGMLRHFEVMHNGKPAVHWVAVKQPDDGAIFVRVQWPNPDGAEWPDKVIHTAIRLKFEDFRIPGLPKYELGPEDLDVFDGRSNNTLGRERSLWDNNLIAQAFETVGD
jgi:hypothetical protein